MEEEVQKKREGRIRTAKTKSKMMTFKDPTEDPTYEAENIAISGITKNIEDGLVFELMDKFSPVIRNFPDQIKQEMLELSAKWSEEKEVYIRAINAVTHGREEGNSGRNKELKEMCLERL